MFKTHVCLVSQQAAPNFLPLLDEKLKPKQVILLVTDQMKVQAEYLQRVIQPLGIGVKLIPFEATGSFDDMRIQLMDLLGPYKPSEIALNVTGGTKWMAITAQEIFRENSSMVFYVDIASGQVLFLDSQIAPHPLAKNVRLGAYLNAYGYELKDSKIQVKGLTDIQRELYQVLITNVAEWSGAIGQLNALASSASDNASRSASLASLPHRDPYLSKLLNACEFAGLLSVSQNTLKFTSEETRFEANGGWLENYINSKLNELKTEQVLQDSPYPNVKVVKGKTENEVDIAFMANNRLHIIECKTKRLAGKNVGGVGTEALYKLDSISALGGLGTKAMLVTYRPLNQYDSQRARELNIKVVQAHELNNLKSHLREWISHA
jgi:hypothetical protein